MPTEAVWAITATVVAGGIAAWFRFTLKVVRRDVENAVRSTVNGRLDRIDAKLADLNSWNAKHDRRHSQERRQLLAAMDRNQLSPPDGWDHPD